MAPKRVRSISVRGSHLNDLPPKIGAGALSQVMMQFSRNSFAVRHSARVQGRDKVMAKQVTHPAGARAFGGLLLVVSAGLAAGLMFMPAPSHLPALLAGLVILAVCGVALTAHGLRQRFAASVVVLAGALIGFGAVAVRGASEEWPRIALQLSPDDARCALTIRGDLPADLYRELRATLDQ